MNNSHDMGSEFTVLFVSQPLQASTADQKHWEMSGAAMHQ